MKRERLLRDRIESMVESVLARSMSPPGLMLLVQSSHGSESDLVKEDLACNLVTAQLRSRSVP